MANGMAFNPAINERNTDYRRFATALTAVCQNLARQMAKDGEGASRLITVRVDGCDTEEDAGKMARAVAGSNLVKAAIFGSDANWGRVLCAMGYSGVVFRPEEVEMSFESSAGSILVCRNGAAVSFSEEAAKKVLTPDEVTISIKAGSGSSAAEAWGCDLTYDYVKINGDYRS
jgi:glutamate N-acetyltransferase/amino-acid N-acetyltransferase